MSNINNKDKPGKYDTEEKRLAKMHMNSLFMFAISLFVAYRTRAEKKK